MANPRIDDLRKRLEKEPGSRLFAQLAEELRKDGELEEAIQVCREGLQRHANYPSAHMTLGRALFDTGDLAAAKKEFEAVLKGAPDNILASRLLGESLEGLGELQAAVDRFKKTLAMAPGDKQVAAKLEATEKALKKNAAPAPVAAPAQAAPPAPQGAEPPPIKVVEVDEPMELERPHEAAPVSFVASPAAPTAAPPAVAPATTQPLAVVKEQEFELERPYDVPTVSVRPAEPPPPIADEPPAPTLPIAGADSEVAPAPVPPPAYPMPEPEPAPPTHAEQPEPEVQPEPQFEPEVEVRAEPAPAVAPPMELSVVAPPAPPEPPAPTPVGPEAPAAQPPAAAAPSEEMASVTLAELYFNQGFADKAIDVLKRLLAREPENERARARLQELETREAALAVEQQRVAAVVGPGVDAKALRRQAIARTIAELEKLLAAVRKG